MVLIRLQWKENSRYRSKIELIRVDDLSAETVLKILRTHPWIKHAEYVA